MNSLTNCCLVDLVDVTLACEYANSKLVEVVTVTDNTEDKVLMFGWNFWLMLSRDSEDEMRLRFLFELLVRPQEVTLAR